MKKSFLLMLLFAGSWVSPTNAQTDSIKVDTATLKFINQSLRGGLKEISDSKMAAGKAITPAVKDFANHMISEHTKLNSQLRNIVKSKGYKTKLPTAGDISADPMLGISTGTALENNYIAMMVADHRKMVALFQAAAQLKDREVSAFAKRTLPIMKSHLEAIKVIAAKKNLKL
jgi:putative membrane protein